VRVTRPKGEPAMQTMKATDRRTLLIVDDEPDARFTVLQMLRPLNCRILEARDGLEALDVLKRHAVDLVVSDIRMPRMDGIRLLRAIREADPETRVLLITAYGEIQDAVEAMKQGAFDYICKPITRKELILKVEKALDAAVRRGEGAELGEVPLAALQERIVGASPGIRRIRAAVQKVHATDSSVLIRGESGTGKELVARAVHRLGPRSTGPFVKVNLSSLAEGVLESELFGHEKGAFTGAHSQRPGRLESAEGGTLFLDEIGDTPPGIQTKLLRFLEEKVFERVGGNLGIRVNARVVSATNADLEARIREGRFRQDLFFRLNVIPIHMPALRARVEDIPLLADHFLSLFSREMKRERVSIEEKAVEKLVRHSWPGNVRELRNVIERAMVLNETGRIAPEEILIAEVDHVGFACREMEKERLVRALEESGGNKSEAARRLGMDRSTFSYRLKKYHGSS